MTPEGASLRTTSPVQRGVAAGTEEHVAASRGLPVSHQEKAPVIRGLSPFGLVSHRLVRAAQPRSVAGTPRGGTGVRPIRGS